MNVKLFLFSLVRHRTLSQSQLTGTGKKYFGIVRVDMRISRNYHLHRPMSISDDLACYVIKMERTFRIAPNAWLFCCICIWKDEHEQVRKFIFRKKREHRFREPIRLYEKTEGAIGLIISMCTDWYLSLSYNPTLILSKPHGNLKDLQRVYKKYVWIEHWNGF